MHSRNSFSQGDVFTDEMLGRPDKNGLNKDLGGNTQTIYVGEVNGGIQGFSDEISIPENFDSNPPVTNWSVRIRCEGGLNRTQEGGGVPSRYSPINSTPDIKISTGFDQFAKDVGVNKGYTDPLKLGKHHPLGKLNKHDNTTFRDTWIETCLADMLGKTPGGSSGSNYGCYKHHN